MLDEKTITAYLDRISANRPERPDLESLRHLHERHVLSVPFESIDIYRGEEIHVDEQVVDKIVHRHRGGVGYELNTAFYLLLESLGFDITLHQGRVRIPERFSPPYNHLMAVVTIGRSRWAVDVGFERASRFPLQLDSETIQQDPHGVFSTRRAEAGAIDIRCDGDTRYRFYEETVALADFRQAVWWHRSCPDAPYLKTLVCSLPTDDGWVTIEEDTLTISTRGETKTEVFTDDASLLEAYRTWFGVSLTERPVSRRHSNGSALFSYQVE